MKAQITEIDRVNDNELTEWRRAVDHAPALPGWYEVRNNGAWPRRMRLVSGFVWGRQMRLWDGARWCAGWSDEITSIMGRHCSHEWRGMKAAPAHA